MRFHLITNFTRVQPPRRRFSAPYNQQYRAYTPSRHHYHQFIRKNRVSETPHHFTSCFVVLRRFYSSKPSNSNTGLLNWYLGMLEKRPILTKSISSAIIFGVADITSQAITMEPHDKWDPIRTLRMAGFGLVILGPAQHNWFNFVARVLPKRDLTSTFKKLAMGQLMFGPMFNGVFFSYNAYLQGESGSEIAARLKRELLASFDLETPESDLGFSLLYWPLCDFLTYKIIPVHLQPLLNSSFLYLWTTYVTYMASLQVEITLTISQRRPKW